MHQSSLPGAHLPALQTFFRVVELRSFRAVAREMGVTQPTVSRQIAALEEHLGTRLLQRTTRRVTPTDPGLALYERARGALQALLQVEDDIRAGEQAIRGVVRIATPGALGRRLVFPAVRPVLALHPALSVELHISDQLVSFTGGLVDFAVRVGLQAEASLTVRRLGLSSQVFVASKGYVRKHGRPKNVADLSGHALVAGAARGPLASLLDELRRSGVRVVITADDVETVYLAVSQGLGVALLPRWLVTDDIESGSLVTCVADAPRISAPVSLVRPAAGWLPRRARLLFDAVAESVTARFARLGDAGDDHDATPGGTSAPPEHGK